jgi:hypothetical protein
MIYELRTYRCAPGRVADVVRRFEQHTVPLWNRHGISHVGFWTVLVGESNHDFIYILRWETLDQRQELWAAFSTDPEWRAAKAQSEANGPIVMSVSNQLLVPTAFSELQ